MCLKKMRNKRFKYENGTIVIKERENKDVPKDFTGVFEHKNGDRSWFKEGKRHRIGGPAVMENGSKYWYKDGKLHREDGPAIIDRFGAKYWYKNHSLHRLDGPAIEYKDGSKEWYKEGNRHRIDGPAVEHIKNMSGSKEWWIDGNYFTWNLLAQLMKKEIYVGKEKGKYGLEWLKFLTEENGICEFPIVPEMEKERSFIYLFISLNKEK